MATSDKRTLLTEVPTSDTRPVLTDALAQSKEARNKALDNAHKALVDAFGPKLNSMIVEKLSGEDNVSEMDIDELIRELENAPEDDDMVKECRQRLDEAKNPSVSTNEKERMYRDIHRKFWAYVQSLPNRIVEPTRILTETDKAVNNFRSNKSGNIQWISHEGSMIICSLVVVSDSENSYISLTQLPEEDRVIISNMTGHQVVTGFFASLDEYKNFSCYAEEKGRKKVSFTLGNRVASIPPHEASMGSSDVKVERKGKDIVIGNQIKLDKNRIQNLVAPTDPTNNGANRGNGFQPRQKVAGRNAYEIRADVLEMALDFAKNTNDKKLDTDDILDIAEAFYSFVEHK